MFKRIPKLYTNIYLATLLQLLIVLFIYSISRGYFYLYNHQLFPNIEIGYFLKLLIYGLKFDISALAYINCLVLLVRFFPLSDKFKAQQFKISTLLFIIVNSFFIVGNITDVAYYPFINCRTQASTLSEFMHDSNAVGILLSYIKPYWDTYVVFTLMVLFLIFITSAIKIKQQVEKQFTIKLFIKRLLILFLIAGLTILGMRGRIEDGYPLGISDAIAVVKNNRDINIVLNTPFSYFQSLGKHELVPERYFMPETEIRNYYSAIHVPDSVKGSFKPKNIVLIVMEGIGNGFIGKFNDNTNIEGFISHTPFLDSLASKSLIFENHYCTARSSIKGINAVLGGFPAYDIYYMNSPYNANMFDGLPRILAEYNYKSTFYCGCNKGSYSFENFSKAVGYNNFVGRFEYNNDDDFDGTWGIYDDKMASYILNDLDQVKQPFIISWFTLTSHGPINLPKEYLNIPKKSERNTMNDAVEYVDDVLKNFFINASKKDWYNNTIFVITSDHSSIMKDYPRYNLADLLYKVPLIIYTPDNTVTPGLECKTASQLDIMPTLLGLLNYKKPYVAFGNDLLNNVKNNFAVSWVDNNYQIVKGDYLLQFNGVNTTGFYNKKLDITLHDNLISDTSLIQHEMELLIKAYLQDYTQRIKTNNMSLVK